MAANKKTLRQQRILGELDLEPSLRIADLAERLNVSNETIRRDFDELTSQGLINRTYGGAVRRQASEPGLNERHQLHIAERESIAKQSVPVLAGARHIMIGSGATTVHVAKRLAVTMTTIGGSSDSISSSSTKVTERLITCCSMCIPSSS